MDKVLHPKAQKLLDKSKSIKGRTLTGQPADQIEIYGIGYKNKQSKKLVNPNNDQNFEKNFNV